MFCVRAKASPLEAEGGGLTPIPLFYGSRPWLPKRKIELLVLFTRRMGILHPRRSLVPWGAVFGWMGGCMSACT